MQEPGGPAPGGSASHESLDAGNREIRLITLDGSLDEGSTIVCRLSKTSLMDNPDYVALSYVWGNPSQTQPIRLNGAEHQVTTNLFKALKRLRGKQSHVVLWVDAICINQGDVIERNNQVRIMHDIYHQAREVFIWLGEADDDSERAMELIGIWGTRKELTSDGIEWTSHPEWTPDPDKMRKLENAIKTMEKPFDPRAWDCMGRFFKRAWWTRAWVVQEVVLACSATLFCGLRTMEWTVLIEAVLKWDYLMATPRPQFLSFDEWRLVAMGSPFLGAIQTYMLLKSQEPEFFRLLTHTQRLEASDERDKVYAFVGLDRSVSALLVPDYRKSLPEVFVDTSWAIMQSMRRMWVVYAAGIGDKTANPSLKLPSWVADWRYNPDRPTFFNGCEADKGGPPLCPGYLDLKLLELSNQGMVHDTIQEVGPPDDGSETRVAWHDLAFSSGQFSLRTGEKMHPTGIPLLQAFFRTLICDDSSNGYGSTKFRNEKNAEQFCARLMDFLRRLGNYLLRFAASGTLSNVDLGNRAITERATGYMRLAQGKLPLRLQQDLIQPVLQNSCTDEQIYWHPQVNVSTRENWDGSFVVAAKHAKKRAFFVTEEGYMGLGPLGVRKGDKICVLLGCDRPLVLRPESGHYLNVGACYVYGIMYGEVIQMMQEAKLEFQEIRLR